MTAGGGFSRLRWARTTGVLDGRGGGNGGGPRRRLLKAVLERAVRRGEVRGDVDLDVVVDLVWGAVFARYVSGVGGEEGFVDGVMDVVWQGIEGIKDESEV